MKKPVWHSGPPPSLGWWPASFYENKDRYRWWNGICWSQCAVAHDSAAEVGRAASTEENRRGNIRWTNRPASWPARSKT